MACPSTRGRPRHRRGGRAGAHLAQRGAWGRRCTRRKGPVVPTSCHFRRLGDRDGPPDLALALRQVPNMVLTVRPASTGVALPCPSGPGPFPGLATLEAARSERRLPIAGAHPEGRRVGAEDRSAARPSGLRAHIGSGARRVDGSAATRAVGAARPSALISRLPSGPPARRSDGGPPVPPSAVRGVRSPEAADPGAAARTHPSGASGPRLTVGPQARAGSDRSATSGKPGTRPHPRARPGPFGRVRVTPGEARRAWQASARHGRRRVVRRRRARGGPAPRLGPARPRGAPGHGCGLGAPCGPRGAPPSDASRSRHPDTSPVTTGTLNSDQVAGPAAQ